MAAEGNYFIGTSGFSYSHWQGVFYPDELPQRLWLENYARQFDTVEINSSFYHLPRPFTCENWKKRVPDDFTFAVKASRFITHQKMLKEVNEPVKIFFEVIRHLEKMQGPILFQLPPGMRKDIYLLRDFIEKLSGPFRYVFEFRNNTWYDDDLFILLNETGCGFCIHDLPDRITPWIVTGGFVYIRFHGARQAYCSLYGDDELEKFSVKIADYSKECHDVYAYFNNDINGYAVQNAKMLNNMLHKSG